MVNHVFKKYDILIVQCESSPKRKRIHIVLLSDQIIFIFRKCIYVATTTGLNGYDTKPPTPRDILKKVMRLEKGIKTTCREIHC
mgnify:FL=1